MNLPNKLTVLRVIMVPFFVFFMLTDVGGEANKWIALAIFAVASFTDLLDGKIARARGLVTNFGKFMELHRSVRWKDCESQRACDKLWKIYGSFGR